MVRARVLAWAGSLGAVALLGACSRFSVTAGTPLPDVSNRYACGGTTYKQVMADLGPPHKVTRVAGGFAFLYEYQDANENQVTVTLANLAAPFTGGTSEVTSSVGSFLAGTFGPSYAWAQGTSRIAFLTFDDSGTLRAAQNQVSKIDLGQQFAFTWLISPQPASDIGALSEPSQTHRWGRRNLRPIPRTLNELQSPDAGPYGFERTGTPRGAGQRSNTQIPPLTGPEEERRRQGNFADE